jgi:hypothetical protein
MLEEAAAVVAWEQVLAQTQVVRVVLVGVEQVALAVQLVLAGVLLALLDRSILVAVAVVLARLTQHTQPCLAALVVQELL